MVLGSVTLPLVFDPRGVAFGCAPLTASEIYHEKVLFRQYKFHHLLSLDRDP